MMRQIFAVIACLLGMPDNISQIAHAQERILSEEPGSPYRALEQFQRGSCQGHPLTHVIGANSIGMCNIAMEELMPQLFPNDPDQPDLFEIVREACRTRATRYEPAGIHWMLEQRLNAVEATAGRLGVRLQTTPLIGALPCQGMGAFAYEEDDGPGVILVNIQFLEFANELAKLASQTILVESVGDSYRIDLSEDATLELIHRNPDLRRALIERIDYFVGGSHGRPIAPTMFGRTIQVLYFDGIEIFAVSHEYGHIYYRHESGGLDVFPAFLGFSSSSQPVARTPVVLREVEADVFGLRLLLSYRQQLVNDPSTNPIFSALLHTVEFYYTSRMLIEEANLILGNSTANPAAGNPIDFQDVELIVDCVYRNDCRAGQIAGYRRLLDHPDHHPSYEFRRQVIRRVIERQQPPGHEAMLQIAALVNRNISLLWNATREEYRAAHHN